MGGNNKSDTRRELQRFDAYNQSKPEAEQSREDQAENQTKPNQSRSCVVSNGCITIRQPLSINKVNNRGAHLHCNFTQKPMGIEKSDTQEANIKALPVFHSLLYSQYDLMCLSALMVWHTGMVKGMGYTLMAHNLHNINMFLSRPAVVSRSQRPRYDDALLI